ncbi:MAG: aldehyde ferredoxin oxidoreductase C-terminal domain-containing protein, partial [Nitrospinota bacterium]
FSGQGWYVPTYVIEGDAESRTFTLTDASDLLGKTTHEKILWLADRYDDAHFAVLGPAGENWQGNRFAGIACSTENQLKSRQPKPRFAGRGGMGNLMGSKNLLAIVVKAPDPKGRVSPVIKAVNLEVSRGEGSRNYRDKRKANGGGGTWRNYPPLHKAGVLPENNFNPQGNDKPANLFRDAFEKNYVVKDESCFKCGIACHKNVYEAVEANGKRKAGDFFVKLDYEPLNLLSTNLGIHDQAQTLAIVELTDDMGFDSISMGVVLGYAMEYNERRDKGAPGEKVFGGIGFGDFEAAMGLIRRCAEGKEPRLGQGVMRLSEALGETDYAMHCKGLELPAYLPETNPGYPFALAGGHMSMRTFLFLIFEEETSLDYWETAILKRGIHYTRDDLVGLCKFAGTPDPHVLDAIRDLTGVTVSKQELKDAVLRTYLQGLLLEKKQGFTEEDYVLPARVYERNPNIKLPQFITPEFWAELRARVLKGFDKKIEEFGMVTAV